MTFSPVRARKMTIKMILRGRYPPYKRRTRTKIFIEMTIFWPRALPSI
jgi:hypothetical protein